MRDKILKREDECFYFLRTIPEKTKYVLIGGYAVSAFGFPRFSVDLDITIPKNELQFFEELLNIQGFKITTEKKDLDEIYAGEFRKYKKKEELPVSVDILTNSVKSRQTGSSYSFNYLFKNSETRTVSGWHPDSKAKVRLANREMIIALKINSMRLTDKRDIIILCYEKPKVKKIIEHLKRCPVDVIKKHLGELLSVINDPKYVNSIKGEFSITDKVFERVTRNTRKVIREIQNSLI